MCSSFRELSDAPFDSISDGMSTSLTGQTPTLKDVVYRKRWRRGEELCTPSWKDKKTVGTCDFISEAGPRRYPRIRNIEKSCVLYYRYTNPICPQYVKTIEDYLLCAFTDVVTFGLPIRK